MTHKPHLPTKQVDRHHFSEGILLQYLWSIKWCAKAMQGSRATHQIRSSDVEWLPGDPVIISEGGGIPCLLLVPPHLPRPPGHRGQAMYTGQAVHSKHRRAPWKILRKDLTTLAQTWSLLCYFNLAPTSHTSNVNIKHDRLIYGLVI